MKELLLLLSVFMMPTTYGMARLRALAMRAAVYMPIVLQKSSEHVKRVPKGRIAAFGAVGATGYYIVPEFDKSSDNDIIAEVQKNIDLLDDWEFITHRCKSKAVADSLVSLALEHEKYTVIQFCSSTKKQEIIEGLQFDMNYFKDARLMCALCINNTEFADKMADVLQHEYGKEEFFDRSLRDVIEYCSEGKVKELLAKRFPALYDESHMTPSLHHFLHIYSKDYKILFKYASLYPQIVAALKQEYIEQQQGRRCEYHGQSSQWGFQQDFTSELLLELHKNGIVTDYVPDNFLYISNDGTLLVDDGVDQQKILDAAEYEQKILMEGTELSPAFAHAYRLSTNSFLFGNNMQGHIGESTLMYTLANTGANVITKLDISKNIFVPLGISREIQNKYADEVDAFLRAHWRMFGGRIVQISVPDKELDNIVYPALAGNNKVNTSYKTPIKTVRGKQVTSRTAFVADVQQDPSRYDKVELDRRSEGAVPLTKAYVLNPHKDVRIFTHDAQPADGQESYYEKYFQQRRELAARIAKDVARHPNMRGKKFSLCCTSTVDRLKEAAQAMR